MIIELMSEMDIQDEGQNIHDSERMRESILEGVSNSKGFFKSQQVGEEDLTVSEKKIIASDLLDQNVALFLQRYWKYIKLEDINYFAASDDYEVNFYLTEIRKYRDTRLNNTRVKNRRYGALQKMVKEGSYFSDGEMKKRNPFLFDQLIGQHLTEGERIAAYKEQHKDERFSTFLLEQLERNAENCLFEKQKNEDEAVVEEEDDDDEEEEEEELEEDDELGSKKPTSITPDEKSRLRSEFTNLMYESFLSGEDKEFDYSVIDYNAEYDPAEEDLDAEDKYFEDDSSEEMD